MIRRVCRSFLRVGTLAAIAAASGTSALTQTSRPAATISRFSPERLSLIDGIVRQGIAAGNAPGAVVVVGDSHGIAYRKAFGNRAVEPRVEPMTTDTIFDVASMTKVIATTPAVMMLIERGRLHL